MEFLHSCRKGRLWPLGYFRPAIIEINSPVVPHVDSPAFYNSRIGYTSYINSAIVVTDLFGLGHVSYNTMHALNSI